MKNLFFLVCVVLTGYSQAQTGTITGVVTDTSNQPLPGVNITVKETKKGTQTDFDGNYKISAQMGEVLVFSFIGMKTEERVVDENTTINVVMTEDSASLDEVVVTGYGVKRTKMATSAAIAEMVSGKVSGLAVGGNFKSGTLTAGEINDIQDFKEWKKILKIKEHSKIREDWGFYLENKIEVVVSDGSKKPINNVKVSIFFDSIGACLPIMKSRTDAFGKAILFKDLYTPDQYENYIVQVYHNGKVFGKKINANTKYLNFILSPIAEAKNVDIMFTIDATGSMGDEMDYLKEELRDIIKRIDNKIGEKRVALTFYRDVGDEYLFRNFDFSSDIEEVQANLNMQSASGGGDYEEAVEKALQISLSNSWGQNAKAKLMFLLLDAPPHLNEKNALIIRKQIKKAQENGIKIIPIVASGADKTVEFLMRFFSVSTNGTYVFLTDDSGIGNEHLKPSKSEYKVEKLNDLIVRLIRKYARV